MYLVYIFNSQNLDCDSEFNGVFLQNNNHQAFKKMKWIENRKNTDKNRSVEYIYSNQRKAGSHFSYSLTGYLVKAKGPNPPYYLKLTLAGDNRSIHAFLKIVNGNEIQKGSSRIITRFSESISNDDNHYFKNASSCLYLCIYLPLPTRTGCDTRSIFKQSLKVLNS